MPKRARAIGTSAQAIAAAEAELGCKFPSSFREWLLKNNGLGIEGVRIFPVFDERDARKTWNSIVRAHHLAKGYWADAFAGDKCSFDYLLAFAEFGTGDYYCFDYSQPTEVGEWMVVHVSHETGNRSRRARTFTEFAGKVASGDYSED